MVDNIKVEDFRIGDRVRICGTEYTFMEFGGGRKMTDMIGKVYSVESVDSRAVYVNKCYWCREDLKNLTQQSMLKNKYMSSIIDKITFDPAALDVDI